MCCRILFYFHDKIYLAHLNSRNNKVIVALRHTRYNSDIERQKVVTISSSSKIYQ